MQEDIHPPPPGLSLEKSLQVEHLHSRLEAITRLDWDVHAALSDEHHHHPVDVGT